LHSNYFVRFGGKYLPAAKYFLHCKLLKSGYENSLGVNESTEFIKIKKKGTRCDFITANKTFSEYHS
jgi:hypothetical protein